MNFHYGKFLFVESVKQIFFIHDLFQAKRVFVKYHKTLKEMPNAAAPICQFLICENRMSLYCTV